jgi:hypothetical protein
MSNQPTAQMGEEAAYNHVLSRAKALPESAIRKRGDVPLALANVSTGLAAVLDPKAGLAARWAPARVSALEEARTLALAASFAASRASQLDGKETDLAALIGQMYEKRDLFLAVMDMAAKWGLLPGERVAKIRAGNGPIDGGQDLIDGVVLCREFSAALENKTPLTTAWLSDAEALGNKVVLEIRSSGARQEINATAREAALNANRIWTLLVDAHTELRKAGFELWGDAVNAYVPPLQSRVGGKREAKEKPKPAG